ncbi:MAG TPA: FAD-dependent oxidoreductase [Gammaproteobacteria bacterium]|nr:FAD-dependent oxidoreductase [Gammaproteobacteria bacterium]
MSKEFDIVVAGGGIAGFTAGLTAARLGRRTLVLTGDVLGGQLLNIEKIDGYPGFPEGVPGYDLCPMAQEQATAAGAETAMAPLTGLEGAGGAWTVATPNERYTARSVILATGTRLRDLGVPGESALRGKGVSQCASCDAPLLRDRPVVVAGGGDSALQEALTLAEHCSTVTIVHRGPAFTAQAAYRALAEAHARISAVPESEVTEILGADAVTGARLRHAASGATSDLECEAVFVFVGLEPNTSFIDDRSLLDASGYVLTDAAMRTRLPGLLAAGTVRAGNACRAAAAAGDGAAAALAADRFLIDGEWDAGPR